MKRDFLYWWHQRLLAEVLRLGPANSVELASNLHEHHRDVLNWLDDLEAADLVVRSPATSFVPRARWVMAAPVLAAPRVAAIHAGSTAGADLRRKAAEHGPSPKDAA